MDPVVESALISAAATVVGVGGTALVAIVGFRYSRSTNKAALDAAGATTDKTVNATREGQLADRYSRAIDQLGSRTVDVTIGGIYALERIAYDSPRDHPTVMEVLMGVDRLVRWDRLVSEPSAVSTGKSWAWSSMARSCHGRLVRRLQGWWGVVPGAEH